MANITTTLPAFLLSVRLDGEWTSERYNTTGEALEQLVAFAICERLSVQPYPTSDEDVRHSGILMDAETRAYRGAYAIAG